MRFRCAAVLAAAAVLGAAAAFAATATDAYPQAAESYLLAINEQVLWERQADTQLSPASLTKLLTALAIVREKPWNESATVTVSAAAAGIEGAKIRLRGGERLRAGDALTAMLVRSANDACLALAEHYGGGAAAFVVRMNALAAELGMHRSSFRTPCGLDAPGQRSTARDLLLLARAAMREPAIAVRVKLSDASITTVGGRAIHFTSSNALIGRLAGTIGVKTGYTVAAGRCLVALAERNGHQVWLVMLKAPDRWWVADGMINAAFASVQAGAFR